MPFPLPLRSHLRYDRAQVAFAGKVPVAGAEVDVSLGWSGAPAEFPAEHCVWAEQTLLSLEEKARQYACAELLPLKNSQWLEEGQQPLTPGEFDARLALQAITVAEDRAVIFVYGDGDLFWGHLVEIAADPAQHFHYAGLLG